VRGAQLARRGIHGARAAVSEGIERVLGVRTKGDIPGSERGFSYGLYRPSSWIVLRELFRRLEVGRDDVLVDVGSGMGRVLLVAARRPFRRVIGIEHDAELTAIARRNIEHRRGRLACRDVELLTIDALEWEVPDDLTVVYLFCPFPDEILARVLDNVVASLDRRPRAVRLIYNFSNVRNRETILATGRATAVDLPVPRHLRRAFAEVRMYRLR
jgi:16S rRNA G966 N2-methylase RsmD